MARKANGILQKELAQTIVERDFRDSLQRLQRQPAKTAYKDSSGKILMNYQMLIKKLIKLLSRRDIFLNFDPDILGHH